MIRQAVLTAGVLLTLALLPAGGVLAAGTDPVRPDETLSGSIPGLAPLNAAQLAEFRRAVRVGSVTAVRRLVSAGVNPNIRMENGDTAFTYAVRSDTPKVAEALLASKDFDVNDPNRFGETPLMLAVFKGDRELFEKLVARNADPNAGGNWNPILYAATEGRIDFIRRLLELGASPNVQTNAGVTPLVMAARKPSREAVMTLLRAGAWRDWCTERGDAPADFARRAGDEELAKFLAVERCAVKGPVRKDAPAVQGGAQ